MFLRILKRDIKRKKTTNLILFLFIVLAATFVAGGANNIMTLMTALDSYFEKAGVPDYFFMMDTADEEPFRAMAEKNDYEYKRQQLIMVEPAEVRVRAGEKLEYKQSVMLSKPGDVIKVFDDEDEELTDIREGDIYLTVEFLARSDLGLKIGDTMNITVGSKSKEFIIRGGVKDAIFGNAAMGMTRFFMNESDYEWLRTEETGCYTVFCVNTDDSSFMKKYNALGLSVFFDMDREGIRMTYFMDMMLAAVVMVLSICLVLISMVILRFVIRFTISEEFREIGVMKAIGIAERKVRGLYIVKYLAISVVGGVIGLGCSILFGMFLMGELDKNMIVSGEGFYIVNLLCVTAVVAIVVLYCYFCTRRIKNISPVDAIRNGENGERYARKGWFSLNRSRLLPAWFLALNDICSDIRKYVGMILVFGLGMLLIVIPVNTINTLKSEHLGKYFNMSECDHVISEEQLLTGRGSSRKMVEDELDNVREQLTQKGVLAKVFQEMIFKMSISCGENRRSSLAFQGLGDVETSQYDYLRGTPPQSKSEVAISYIVADRIGAEIGDTVKIKNGVDTKTYIVTAIFQSMNNMGEGIRLHPDEELDYSNTIGMFGIQIRYSDHPGGAELDRRKEMLGQIFTNAEVQEAGEYINEMMGDYAGQSQGIKRMVLLVVLCINMLVTVLMVKSFMTREKGEIAILKAVGFQNRTLILWQTLRIGLVLFVSIGISLLLGKPLSEVVIGPVFQTMGAAHVSFEIVPAEVYGIYPAAVFVVTMGSSVLTALQLKKISASDTAGME